MGLNQEAIGGIYIIYIYITILGPGMGSSTIKDRFKC